MKMRKEKTQISKIRNKKREITTNTKEIQGITRDYFENLYSNKLENLKETDTFLDIYDLNKSITHNEIEAAIKSLPKMKVQDLIDSLLNSTRPLRRTNTRGRGEK
jgi:hypothetical protein